MSLNILLDGPDASPARAKAIKDSNDRYWINPSKKWEHADARGHKRAVRFEFQVAVQPRDKPLPNDAMNAVAVRPLTVQEEQLRTKTGDSVKAYVWERRLGVWPASVIDQSAPQVAHETGHLLHLQDRATATDQREAATVPSVPLDLSGTGPGSAPKPLDLMNGYLASASERRQMKAEVTQEHINQIVSPGISNLGVRAVATQVALSSAGPLGAVAATAMAASLDEQEIRHYVTDRFNVRR